MTDSEPPDEGASGPKSEAPFRWFAHDFERRAMVPWFSPSQLAATGVRALMAAVFGSYADKRDVMALGTGAKVCSRLAGRKDVWIDYVADLGDGWDSTYSVAWLLAQEQLRLAHGVSMPEGCALPRGDLLVLGGDEVYPTASRDEYHHRFVGPYTASLPWVDLNAGEAPLMFALPGNHDWYDGLASFTRLFCQERWIGGRKTAQSRSYFAIQLPHRWWLWGIDTQLHSDLDLPQLDYFRDVASGKLTGNQGDPTFFHGHKVILCVPNPTWVATAAGTEDERKKRGRAYANLDYLERNIIEEHGGELALTLAGDDHHYARYTQTDVSSEPLRRQAQHKITAGGGGAYTLGTHELPGQLELGADRRPYVLECRFPSVEESRRLVRRASLAFLGRPHNWPFAGLLAVLYLWFAWLVQSTSRMLVGSPGHTESFLEEVRDLGLADAGDLFMAFLQIVGRSPVVAFTTALIIAALVVFAETDGLRRRLVVGVPHGVLHVTLALCTMWLVAKLTLGWMGLDVNRMSYAGVFIVAMLAFGALGGGLLMGLYLWLANRWLGANGNEALSCQSDPDYKNFVRMHLSECGELTVYPIGVREVLRRKRWRKTDRADAGGLTADPWYQPNELATLSYELIENEPIRIPGWSDAPQPNGDPGHG